MFITQRITIEDPRGDAKIHFRRPTTEEWSHYCKLAFPNLVGGNLVVPDVVGSRLEFFKLWCEGIEGYVDDAGEITVEEQDRLPVDLRVEALWRGFDRGYNLNLSKNSDGISGVTSTAPERSPMTSSSD